MSASILNTVGPTLDGVLDWTWRSLSRGVSDRRHPFRTGVLATQGVDGASARTVVLREADRAARIVRFHTDRRSPKVSDLATGGRVEWVFWDPRHKVQVRLRGVAGIHVDDDVSDARWRATPETARLCYRQTQPPGEAVDVSDEPSQLPDSEPAEPDAGRERFCVVTVSIERVDWLHLRAAGHARARFEWGGGATTPVGTWVAP